MILSTDELYALGRAIDAAWKSGSIRDPEGAFNLLRASEKIHQEWTSRGNGTGGPESDGESNPMEEPPEDRESREEAHEAIGEALESPVPVPC